MLVPPFNKMARKRGFNELVTFNDIMRIPLAGLAVHMDKIKEAPAEIVKMITALLKSVEYIRNRKREILSLMEKSWTIKEPEVREGIYQDMVGLFSRNGIASDESMKNVIQLVQEARKSKGNMAISDVADWSFAKRANEELKKYLGQFSK
jgi:hypothetical protein